MVRFLYPDPMRKVMLDDAGTWGHVRSFCDCHRPSLVVVDSLEMSHRLDSRRAGDMKGILDGLAGIARGYQLGMLVVMHMRKRFGDQSPYAELSIEEISGTSLFLYKARSVILFDYADKYDLYKSGTPRVRVARSSWRWRPELIMNWDEGGLWFRPVREEHRVSRVDVVREALEERGRLRRAEVEGMLEVTHNTAYKLLRAAGAEAGGDGWWRLEVEGQGD